MAIKEALVTFKTALLIRDNGFENIAPNKLRRDYYTHLGELNGDCTDYIKAICQKKKVSHLYTIDAPTQSVVQKWFRDVRNVNIEVVSRKYKIEALSSFPRTFRYNVEEHYSKESYNSYEEALEEGLQFALK